MQIKKVLKIWLLLWLMFPVLGSAAEPSDLTEAIGQVVDAETGETLPYVQIYFVQPTTGLASTIGTTTDLDGRFKLSNRSGYTTINVQMVGYKTQAVTLKKGHTKDNMIIKLQPDAYGLQDIVVTPKRRKREYKRRGNPAVELALNVISRKDSAVVRTADRYVASTYTRNSFALDGFNPDFEKGVWKKLQLVEKYVDTTGVYPSLTLSIRENLADEYYQRKPRKEKRMNTRKRMFGLESMLTTQTLQNNLNAVLKDIDITNNDIDILFNRFVSPLSSTIATSFYQFYIMDTVMIDGRSCTDLAFVPVNSESYGFTGHMYIVNDSTFKIKRYTLSIPQHINLNFVSDFSLEQTYEQLDNGLWAPDRANTYAKFYITNRKRTLLVRQMKLYTGFDFEKEIDPKLFSSMVSEDLFVPADTITIREDLAQWDELRPEPLSRYEEGIVNMLDEFKHNPTFNSLIMAADALSSEFVSTVPSYKWGESKWDFGPIYNTVSWNILEGVRLRIGGMSTGNLNHHFFMRSYAAFGTTDLRPKYNITMLYSFPWKEYHPYGPLRHYIQWSAQYEVEEPGQLFSIVDRDNILMSIPTGVPHMKNFQYVFHANVQYKKEWQNSLQLTAGFDFENNEPAGTLYYDRLVINGDHLRATAPVRNYNCYQFNLQLRYTPGGHFPVNRQGQESAFNLEKDIPVLTFDHYIGYLDDHKFGGSGFFYNRTEVSFEKRFWLSGFGHLDARVQAGYIWNKVPFTKLYIAPTSTSIFLGLNSFNLMQPMEFLMDEYVSLYLTYCLKGWIMNRIPGINRLKLRGVVSFAGVYGGLTNKNNPSVVGNTGLYAFPESATFNEEGYYVSGNTISPIGKLPYMEMTAGFENILKFVRIDYVRRLTYNDYLLPDGIHRRRYGAWGRNGVKVTVRFAL